MLNDLKSHLKELADQDGTPDVPKPLQAFILMIPQMVGQLRAWMDDPAMPASLKELHGYMLTYLFHPVDFVPEEETLLGYLDDAYLIGYVYHQIYTQMHYAQRRHLPHMEDVSKQVPDWLRATEKVLPAETRKIRRMLEELSEGNRTSFNRMMEQPGKKAS